MNFYRISFDPQIGPFGELARALKERIEDRWETKVLFEEPANLKISYTEGERFGEIIKTDGGYEIRGTEAHDLWNMAGKILRSAPAGKEFCPAPKTGVFRSISELCGMYFATHFNNYYCEAPIEQVHRYMEDLALWGMECLHMWFDLHHYTGMDDPNAKAMILRLLSIQEHIRKIGLKFSIGSLANEGFSSTPNHLKGTDEIQNGYIRKPDGYYHTEICPSTEEGMALILKNRKEMLEVFAKYKPDFFGFGPYDQGGCTCKECAPWGSRGYLKTTKEVAKLVRKYLPDTKIVLSTWYFGVFYRDNTEWEELYEAFDRGELNFVDFISGDFPAEYPKFLLEHPAPRPIISFPEISMYGTLPWGGYGANPMPNHILKKWKETEGVTSGGTPYSEGIYEDINKVICLQLFRDNRNPYETVREYLRYECCISEDQLDNAVHMIQDLEDSLIRDSYSFQTAEKTVTPWNTEKIEEAEALAQKIHASLSEKAQKNPKWLVLYLRANIDGILLRSDFRITEEICSLCGELDKLYYSQKAIRQIRPFCREQIPVLEAKVASPTWKANPVLWWEQ